MGLFEEFYKFFLMVGAVFGILVALERLYFVEPTAPDWIAWIMIVIVAYLLLGGIWKFIITNLKQEIDK